jgi:hypothetical protein
MSDCIEDHVSDYFCPCGSDLCIICCDRTPICQNWPDTCKCPELDGGGDCDYCDFCQAYYYVNLWMFDVNPEL